MTRHIHLMYLCDNSSLIALTKSSKRSTQTGQDRLLIGSIKVWKHISVIIKKKKSLCLNHDSLQNAHLVTT